MAQRTKTQQRDCLPNDFDLSISRDILDQDVRACLDGVYQITIAGAGVINITVNRGVRVIDAWLIKTTIGGVGDTVDVGNGATGNPITNQFDLNVADNALLRATTLDAGEMFIAAGGRIRIISAQVTNATCILYVRCIPAIA